MSGDGIAGFSCSCKSFSSVNFGEEGYCLHTRIMHFANAIKMEESIPAYINVKVHLLLCNLFYFLFVNFFQFILFLQMKVEFQPDCVRAYLQRSIWSFDI